LSGTSDSTFLKVIKAIQNWYSFQVTESKLQISSVGMPSSE